jgi:hypothetical protein
MACAWYKKQGYTFLESCKNLQCSWVYPAGLFENPKKVDIQTVK